MTVLRSNVAPLANLETAPSRPGVARDEQHDTNARFAILADAIPQIVWSSLPDGHHDYYNGRWYEFTGVLEGSTDGEGWHGLVHPDDQARAWTMWRKSLSTGCPYEIEYRLRHRSGEYRWALGRALPVRDAAGRITRWMGTCTDIDEQKRSAEQNELLSRELSHRIKNIFAVIGGLIGLTSHGDMSAPEFARGLRARIAALGRAHEYVRPHSEESARTMGPSTLQAMTRALLSAYPALDQGRLTIDGDDAPLDDRGATPVALAIHELATNAAKYGGLSTQHGRVAVTITASTDDVVIDWRESGGPSVPDSPERVGFGTRLVDMSIVYDLGGTIERRWVPAGLEVRITVEKKSLVRG